MTLLMLKLLERLLLGYTTCFCPILVVALAINQTLTMVATQQHLAFNHIFSSLDVEK